MQIARHIIWTVREFYTSVGALKISVALGPGKRRPHHTRKSGGSNRVLNPRARKKLKIMARDGTYRCENTKRTASPDTEKWYSLWCRWNLQGNLAVAEGPKLREASQSSRWLDRRYWCWYNSEPYYSTKTNEKWMQALDWYIICTFTRWYNKKHQRRNHMSKVGFVRSSIYKKGLKKMARALRNTVERRMSESRVRENLLHGLMRGGWKLIRLPVYSNAYSTIKCKFR